MIPWRCRCLPNSARNRCPTAARAPGAASGLEYELVETSVGNTGVLTCLTGEILRAAEPRYRTEKYADFAVSFPIRTPAEMLVFDLIVHRDVFGERVPRIQLFSDLFDGSPTFQYGASDRLPVLEPLECLAPDLELLRLREFPRYADLLRFALERLGWTREEFRVFRMRLPFPPIPTTLMLTHPLPEAPGTIQVRSPAGAAPGHGFAGGSGSGILIR